MLVFHKLNIVMNHPQFLETTCNIGKVVEEKPLYEFFSGTPPPHALPPCPPSPEIQTLVRIPISTEREVFRVVLFQSTCYVRLSYDSSLLTIVKAPCVLVCFSLFCPLFLTVQA